MTYSKDHLTKIRAEIEAAARAVAAKHGLAFLKSRGVYGERLELKLEFGAKAEDGSVVTPESTAFTRYASMYGMKPEWLGRTFRANGGIEYTIVGLNMRARKRPVQVRAKDGGRFVFPAESVIRAMAISEVA
jgi:hypothetical protein